MYSFSDFFFQNRAISKLEFEHASDGESCWEHCDVQVLHLLLRLYTSLVILSDGCMDVVIQEESFLNLAQLFF